MTKFIEIGNYFVNVEYISHLFIEQRGTFCIILLGLGNNLTVTAKEDLLPKEAEEHLKKMKEMIFKIANDKDNKSPVRSNSDTS